MKKILQLITISTFASGLGVQAGEVENTINFEAGQQWQSIPLELPALMKQYGVTEKDLWSAQSFDNEFWKLNSVSLKELNSGLKLSNKHVKQGKTSGLWSDLPTYPTIATNKIPHDWSKFNSLAIRIYSEQNTGDTITLGMLSDNPGTKWKDYYTFPVKIDWTGWKKVIVPFNSLDKIGSPSGLNRIDALYLFAKAYGHQPNPYTKLYLDKISLENNKPASANKKTEFLYLMRHTDKINPASINHNYPEKASKEPEISGNKFISHQTYHRKERSIYKYYPRFAPGYVSFSPEGKAYIYSGDVIEWLDDKGKWQVCSLKPVLINWAKKQGWKAMKNNWGAQGGDPAIRFDKDGDMYVLAAVAKHRPNGVEDGWRNRMTLLLHSQDKGKNWRVYKLPGRMVSFEKLDGHNQECLDRPPVILLGDYSYFPGADHGKYMLLPEKQPDGTLSLARKIKYSEDSVEVNYHSGDGNVVLTANGKIYIAYGWNPSKRRYRKIADKLKTEGKEWSLENLKGTKATQNLPPMPEHHQGLELSFHQRNHLPKGSEYFSKFSKDGVPTFVRSYDLKTGKLSKPVYIGSGGGMLDGHNWPAITIDSKGIIHALINGHHNPVVYTHTLKPYDISSWTPPEYIKTTEYSPCLSYASFNCDKNDNLYSTHRSTTGYYNNRISLYRKKPGKRWEKERTLVAPFKGLYFAWRHRMTYDPYHDRLILSYYSNGSMSCMSRDMYEFLIFQRPEQEMKLRKRIKKLKIMPKDPYWDSWTYTIFTFADSGEIASIISSDGGEKWHLLTTDDLISK